MKAAARLQLIHDQWDNTTFAERDDVLTYNRKLWTVLVTSATSADNPLPDELKGNIASLGLFIFKHTMAMMVDPEPTKLNPLININRKIAEGLRAKPLEEDAG